MKRVMAVLTLGVALGAAPQAHAFEWLDRCCQDFCNCLCAPFTALRYQPGAIPVAPPIVSAPAPPVYQVPLAPMPVPAQQYAGPTYAAPAPMHAAPAPNCATPEPTCMAMEPSCAAEPNCAAPMYYPQNCGYPPANCYPYPMSVPAPAPPAGFLKRFCDCLCQGLCPRAAEVAPPASSYAYGQPPMAPGYAPNYDSGYSQGYAYESRPGDNVPPGAVDFKIVSDEPVNGPALVSEGPPSRPSADDVSNRSAEPELLPPAEEVRGQPVSD